MLATTLSLVVIFVPGLVHVEHLGALPLPVRHHRGGRGAGEPARLVHADADDERAPAPRRGRDGRHGGQAASRGGLLRAGSIAATRGCCAWSHAAPASLVALLAARRRSPRRCRSTAGPAGVHPDRRRRGRVRGQRQRRRRARASPRWTRSMRAVEGEIRATPRRAHRARDRRRRLPRQASTRAAPTSASRRTRSAIFSLGRLWRETLRGRPLARLHAATTPSAT